MNERIDNSSPESYSAQCTCGGDYPWHDNDCPMYGSGDALAEVERLRALIGEMKQEWVKCHNWGQRPDDTLRNIEHLTACALAPAPNARIAPVPSNPLLDRLESRKAMVRAPAEDETDELSPFWVDGYCAGIDTAMTAIRGRGESK